MRCAWRSLWLNVNQKVLHAHVNQITAAQVLPPGAASNATSWCNVTTLESPAEEHECIGVQQTKPMSYHATLKTADASANFAMRYLVKARMETGQVEALASAAPIFFSLGQASLRTVRRPKTSPGDVRQHAVIGGRYLRN